MAYLNINDYYFHFGIFFIWAGWLASGLLSCSLAAVFLPFAFPLPKGLENCSFCW